MRNPVLSILIVLSTVTVASAQQRPLVTEDPETIGLGLVLLEGGFDFQRSVSYPVSGLEGNLLRVPTLGVSFGISSIAELQLDGGLYNRLSVNSRQVAPLSNLLDFTGDHTSDVEDITIATKIRVAAEKTGRPAIGVRFATRLPNASNESGLGLDTTDFWLWLLAAKSMGPARIAANLGAGVLGIPTRGDRQNDVWGYGLSVTAPLGAGWEAGAEVQGFLDVRGDTPVGTEERGQARAGARRTAGPLAIDGAILLGLADSDLDVGVAVGVAATFHGVIGP